MKWSTSASDIIEKISLKNATSFNKVKAIVKLGILPDLDLDLDRDLEIMTKTNEDNTCIILNT